MYEQNRGEIVNEKRYCQKISYVGLERLRNITPTDIDGFIDYNGNTFVFMEFKFAGYEMEKGQEMALVRLVDVCQRANTEACLLVIHHEEAAENIINAKDCIVTSMYYDSEWYYPNLMTVLDVIEWWEKRCFKKGIHL